jgi:hypothetical protein
VFFISGQDRRHYLRMDRTDDGVRPGRRKSVDEVKPRDTDPPIGNPSIDDCASSLEFAPYRSDLTELVFAYKPLEVDRPLKYNDWDRVVLGDLSASSKPDTPVAEC